MCAGGRGTHRRGQRPPESRDLVAIAKDVRTLGVHNKRGTHCRKRWEDIRRWSRKTAEAQLGMASQRRRGASRHLTPLMSRILAVAYPYLDGHVRTSQQTQGASSGGGEVASEHEGAASHMALEGHATESEYTSGTEGQGSSTAGTRADISDSDSFSEGSSLVVAATSVLPQQQVQPPPSAPAPPSQQPLSVCPVPAHPGRASSSARSQGTASPPPEKHPKIASARRERPKTPGTKIPTLAPAGSRVPPGTPPKVLKGHKRTGKGGKGSTPDKSGSRPAGQEGPTSPIPGVQEDTHRPDTAAQEGPASHVPGGQEDTHTGRVLQPRRAPQATRQMCRKAPPATCQVASDIHTWAGSADQDTHLKHRSAGPFISSTAELGTAISSTAEQGTAVSSTAELGPSSQAPLNRAPPSQAPLNRAPLSQAPLNWALHLKHR
ncbi:hypothetical protein NDU88_003447 [Pleurodeles waltl]|uniref:Uncharacterized protein n=1 Tax=Pleurodeles waltl TaxID=8319 RepID=A0AAV7RD46_PLEWA|nr:hypothetical protein NDU88_003447 [Pleurodeles waltl]